MHGDYKYSALKNTAKELDSPNGRMDIINYKDNKAHFIRLNNKPYPIKDDTFEMWNSYIDRSLIDTIKLSYNNCSGWFFMRKMSNRMDNENNYTVLSYFNYLEQNQLQVLLLKNLILKHN